MFSAYKRKKELYEKLYGFKDLDKLHKRFIEEDITGIDIMPFAAHITALNLTTQNMEEETNIVRVANKDSLDLADYTKKTEFNKKGIKISTYSESIQKTLFGAINRIRKESALSPSGEGSEFYIKPVDAIIMNPPFSDREKMPIDMRQRIKNNKTLGNICGQQINLWGYFLALSDLLLKNEGKLGAVIPISLINGKATEKIRDYFFKNYYIRYMIKSTKDLAFSEGALFKDILFVVEKRKPKKDNYTSIVFLKKSIRELNFETTKKIIEKINKNKQKEYLDEDFEVYSIENSKILEFKDNLIPLLKGSKVKNTEHIINFLKGVFDKAGNKLEKLDTTKLLEGFHSSPEGLSELVFITNPIHPSRTSRNVVMILKKENGNKVTTRIKETNEEIMIPKDKLEHAIKSFTGVTKMDATKKHDFIVKGNFAKFDKVKISSKWGDKKFNWIDVEKKLKCRLGHLIISHKINLISQNTSLISIYDDIPFTTSHGSGNVLIEKNKDTCKIYCLFLNSILGLLQLFEYMGESTGEYSWISQSDFALFKQIKISNLSQKEKQILVGLFDKIKNVDFPSIIDQLENRFETRLEMDKTILKILGFTDKKINEELPKIYEILLEELKAMKEIRK